MKHLKHWLLAIACILPFTANAAVEVDKAAPNFSLQNTAGETVQLSDYKGKYVVLEWTNHLCPYVEKHYGSPVIVTSGYRSANRNQRIGGANGSRHTTCEAADVQIKGVSKWELAKFVRSMPERGGVGTYCHTQSVHIDIGSVRDWNWRCRR